MLHDVGIINLWTFLAGALVIILLPGPNSLYVLRTGMSRGAKAASKAIAGVMLGDLILIFLHGQVLLLLFGPARIFLWW